MDNALQINSPGEGKEIPFVLDSPHSGNIYPDDFGTKVPINTLKTGWDAFVEELWEGAVDCGATLISANFPRTYIDPNRAPDDIDETIIEKGWPFKINPTKYSDRGMGLLRKYALPDILMYKKPLRIDEVRNRLENYYLPYHRALKFSLDYLYERYGHVWHIDCHSMKSTGNAMNIDNGLPRPDLVLGDDDGNCADPNFTQLVKELFEDKGYNVGVNDPYKGGYIIKNYSNPSQNRHSIQIEINRAIYMDEERFEKAENYENFKKDIEGVAQQIAEFIKSQ